MISQLGLVINMIGVVLLAIFNIPKDLIHKDGHSFITSFSGEDHPDTITEKGKYRRCRRFTIVGYWLLGIGFALQFIAGNSGLSKLVSQLLGIQ